LVEQAVARSGASELAAMIDEYLAPVPAKGAEETADLAVAEV
jgi:hypothetical protein